MTDTSSTTKGADGLTLLMQLGKPTLLSRKALPGKQASLMSWGQAIRHDPLLSIQVFQQANSLMQGRDTKIKTVAHAVAVLGTVKLSMLAQKVAPIDSSSTAGKGLRKVIGDSLVAVTLMRHWFAIRRIPWTEDDYWLTLFHQVNIWVSWLVKPVQMEHLEFHILQGEKPEKKLTDVMQMPTSAVKQWVCDHFKLPHVRDTESDPETMQNHKDSALKFFLPFSHQLAFEVRHDWHSNRVERLCHQGETSLGLTEFKPMLKQWITMAAREHPLAEAAIAARRLVAQQTKDQKTPPQSGFSAKDLAKATNKPAPPASPSNPKAWPQASRRVKRPSAKSNLNWLEDSRWAANRRNDVNLTVIREIRRQLRGKAHWHSAIEIQESALYGLSKGLAFSRIVVLDIRDGFWKAFDSEGCQNYTLLRNLILDMHSNKIMSELSRRATAVWINDNNRSKAQQMLPRALLEASANEDFMMRSFAIGQQVTMLLYADIYDSDESLGDDDYKLFREYCADWNTALARAKTELR